MPEASSLRFSKCGGRGWELGWDQPLSSCRYHALDSGSHVLLPPTGTLRSARARSGQAKVLVPNHHLLSGEDEINDPVDCSFRVKMFIDGCPR